MRTIAWLATIAYGVARTTPVLDQDRHRRTAGENLRGVLFAVGKPVQRVRLQLLPKPNEMHYVHSRHWLPPLRAWRGRQHLETGHATQRKAGCARRAVGVASSRRSTDCPRREDQSVLFLHIKVCKHNFFNVMFLKLRINFTNLKW